MNEDTATATVVNSASELTLPVGDQVGVTTHWVLPINRSRIKIEADFIGWASSRRDNHYGHEASTYGSVTSRCRACRWFEPRIFREIPDPERYLILFSGFSIVPGETINTSFTWAHSGEEVVLALSTPNDPIPHKCPVCNGTKLVSRPPGVPGDLQSWGAASLGPYPCQVCEGTGIVKIGGIRFTIPASRVLAQAASFDDEIRDAWDRYQRPIAS